MDTTLGFLRILSMALTGMVTARTFMSANS